ncbi:substrate-binding domain-containing protein [Streptomyces sp. NPDC059740]|uniref:substrate-binding domain-containing protein n=1 Tax=Streptomyces sp. NPDC059740 TaxID=3346926 RepID=UPI0036599010
MADPSTAPGRQGAAQPPHRPRLGLVTDNIHFGVGVTLWAGTVAAAERADADVVAFPVGQSPAGPRGALAELLAAGALDGVICWTSTLGLTAAGRATEELLHRLGPLPVVSLNQALGDHETLRIDSDPGVREAVGHLVEVHGRTRPAFLRGPSDNPVPLDRYRAYTRALSRHRIPLDRSLVVGGPGFGGGAGAWAVRALLDVRGLRPGRDFDALVVSSDVLAADALRSLTERGVRVPEDVAVVSFNDSPEARLADPPLTSVSLPFADLGALAVDTLLARLQGAPPPARTVVPGRLVVRRSCGCHPALAARGGQVARGTTDRPAPPGWPPPRSGPDSLRAVFARCPASADALADAFRADLTLQPWVPPGGFLPLLESVVGRAVRTGEDARRWDEALLAVRSTLARVVPAERLLSAERLLADARSAVAERDRRRLEYERWADEQDARRLRALGTDLTTVVDVDGLVAALTRHLPRTGVRGCRLALYPPGTSGGPPLVHEVPGEEPTAPTAATPPHPGALLPDRDRPAVTVAEDFRLGPEHLGFALFDVTGHPAAGRRGGACRALGDQVGAALKGVRGYEELRRARDAAEQANRLKSRLLDNATDELRTPVERILHHVRAVEGDAASAARREAARLLDLVDGLLDLSRSEIDALDLDRELLDPRPLLVTAFEAARQGHREPEAAPAAAPATGDGALRVPSRLPAICGDAARLRQILLHLLAAAAGSDAEAAARCSLTAEVRPPVLSVRITGPALRLPAAAPSGTDEDLFEPFLAEAPMMRWGPAVARRLAVLHGGSVSLCRCAGAPAFRLDLPLPTPAEPSCHTLAGGGRPLLAVGAEVPAEVAEVGRAQGLAVHRLRPEEDPAPLLDGAPPSAVAWDAAGPVPQPWTVLHRLVGRPAYRHTPFLLYGPVSGAGLAQAVERLRPPPDLARPVVVALGREAERERMRRLVAAALPARVVRTVSDGAGATDLVGAEEPGLLVVGRELPGAPGFDVVERLYAGARPDRPAVPVLMVSSRGFTAEDARRADAYPALVLLGLGILSDQELSGLVAAMVREHGEAATHRAHDPVRHALVYLERHYRQQVSRGQIARAVGVSEHHLGRLFHRRLGVTLWEYLTRLRVQRAKERLRESDDSVQAVARAVGFQDRAYFSRVFRKVTGVAPHVYRRAS